MASQSRRERRAIQKGHTLKQANITEGLGRISIPTNKLTDRERNTRVFRTQNINVSKETLIETNKPI